MQQTGYGMTPGMGISRPTLAGQKHNLEATPKKNMTAAESSCDLFFATVNEVMPSFTREGSQNKRTLCTD